MVILHTVLEHGCQLVPTLQTWAGMVLDCGNARQRASAKETSFFNDREAEILANAAHLLQQLPFTPADFDEGYREILVQNLWACTAQATVTRSSLLEYIKHRKRLDVEQAVAMVLTFVPAEVGSKLAPLVSDMFFSSNMWRELDDFEFENTKTLDAARERKMTRLRDTVAAMAKVEPVDDDLRLLMRVRRERSALSCSQRLSFPKCLITLLPEDERKVWSESYASGKQTDVKIDCGSVINVTKTQFARMQRWLSRLDGDNREKARFIREVREFEKEVCWADSQIKALEKTEDPAALAFSFMAVQRRLQLKVVSDEAWTEFLKKEQGRGVLQNRPEIVTSFEEELARHATDVPALTAIRPPTSFSMQCSATPLEGLIDKACILMEQYVLVFSNGRFENLRYYKVRKEGWKGRGPEDVYNLLVDLLGMLRERGDGRFAVGPCHKFLAKDIMAWNNAWADDAFAPGKIPGWVDWLQERQKLRIQLDPPEFLAALCTHTMST